MFLRGTGEEGACSVLIMGIIGLEVFLRNHLFVFLCVATVHEMSSNWLNRIRKMDQ